MIVIDSIGFSGTHSITDILREVPNSRVAHGSKNFDTLTGLGPDNVSPVEFARQMVQAKEDGQKCYAVHCTFDPVEAKPIFDHVGIKHQILMREPIRQIRSCYAWITKKIMDGDAGALRTVMRFDRDMLTPMGLNPSLSNVMFAFAVSHCTSYAMRALASELKIVRMEDILNDEQAFRDTFDIPDDVPLSHFSKGNEKHISSHKSKVEALGLDAPDEDAIVRGVTYNVGKDSYSFDEFSRELGY
jgi:hypothetical protein